MVRERRENREMWLSGTKIGWRVSVGCEDVEL